MTNFYKQCKSIKHRLIQKNENKPRKIQKIYKVKKTENYNLEDTNVFYVRVALQPVHPCQR